MFVNERKAKSLIGEQYFFPMSKQKVSETGKTPTHTHCRTVTNFIFGESKLFLWLQSYSKAYNYLAVIVIWSSFF